MLKPIFKRLGLTALLVLGAGSVHADAVNELSQLLSGHEAARAEFTQFALSSDGDRAEDSTGHFVVARPNRFRWVTETPFVQEIVSDGEFIWIYDPDLEQVTRKPSIGQNDSAPAMILNGRIEQLSERFSMERIDSNDGGAALYELKPIDPENSTFTRIRLLFDNRQISELSLEDSLGQRSMLVLHNLEYDPELEAGLFEFVPPEGADVIMDAGL